MDSRTSQLHPANFVEFAQEARRANVVAVARTIAAGSIDPLDAFVKVAGPASYAFLLESVEGGEVVAKYSFLSANPHMIVRGRGDETTIERRGVIETRAECVMDYLRRHFEQYKLANLGDLGPLAGGAVGYLGYGAAKWFEPVLKRGGESDSQPESDHQREDALFMFYRSLVVFDHVQQQMRIISVVFIEEADASDVRLRALYERAVEETDRIEKLLTSPIQSVPIPGRSLSPRSLHGQPVWAETVRAGSSDERKDQKINNARKRSVHSNWTREDFEKAVGDVKEHIMAGDCYQVVISQRFARDVTVGPIPIYRALRQSNPAPYTYLLKIGDDAIIGASPEMLVRCRGQHLDYRPIAGTRKRGATEAEDDMLGQEMRADEKEVAEHMMLVDLGRNDLGRVAQFGSVKVEDLMSVERYSKVQHLVSSLSARLRAGADRFDALAACFPAGTVTGAPKVRAMEIIRELEPDDRGVYAGAVLYLDYAGNLDSCIAIRTIVLRKGEASVQAGAGIVADSVPEREYDETVHKAQALLRALEMAEESLAAD